VARGDQLGRQWRLIQLLARPQGLALSGAARELACSIRTVWRDLRALENAGFPVYSDREGRQSVWRLERTFSDRLPVPLTLPEALALFVSRDLLDAGGVGPIGPAIASIIGKIRALLTPGALAVADAMRALVGARTVGAKLQVSAREYLAEINRALAEQRTLEMRYYSLSAETERRVDPYHVTFYQGGLYLVGYCHLRRDVRIFAVERIRALRVLDATFVRPPGFDAEAYLRDAWGVVRGDLIAVRAVFSAAAAPHVRGRLWHASQEVRELPGGRLELRLRVADTLEVRRWLLGFGAEVEVLEPPALREAIRREAERLVAALAPTRKPLARVGAGLRSSGRATGSGGSAGVARSGRPRPGRRAGTGGRQGVGGPRRRR
jgi:predicted DNA-binding transcriptional regulator YafY